MNRGSSAALRRLLLSRRRAFSLEGARSVLSISREKLREALTGERMIRLGLIAAVCASLLVFVVVTLTVVTDGREHPVTAKIAAMDAEELAANEPGKPAQGKWGLQLQDVNPQLAQQLGLKSDHGAVVVEVKSGSPADEAGVRQGDVILEINRQPVKSVKEVKELVAKTGDKDTLLLLVQSEQGKHYVVLKG